MAYLKWLRLCIISLKFKRNNKSNFLHVKSYLRVDNLSSYCVEIQTYMHNHINPLNPDMVDMRSYCG